MEGPKELLGDSRSILLQSIPVDGGPDQAAAQATEVARTHVPARYETLNPEECGRRVFRTTDREWLVEFTRRTWPDSYAFPTTHTALIRVSIAELEYEQEALEPERPAKKGKFGRLGKG